MVSRHPSLHQVRVHRLGVGLIPRGSRPAESLWRRRGRTVARLAYFVLPGWTPGLRSYKRQRHGQVSCYALPASEDARADRATQRSERQRKRPHACDASVQSGRMETEAIDRGGIPATGHLEREVVPCGGLRVSQVHVRVLNAFSSSASWRAGGMLARDGSAVLYGGGARVGTLAKARRRGTLRCCRMWPLASAFALDRRMNEHL
jgi:hypothetical protein